MVLEKDKYHYQKVLSDIAGQDVENHDNDPKILIKKVRNWLSTIHESYDYSGANEIWLRYSQFTEELFSELSDKQYTESEIKELPYNDFIKFARKWIAKFKS